MTNKRWIASVLKAAGDSTIAMPWQRGPRRGRSIQRRGKDSAKAKLAGA